MKNTILSFLMTMQIFSEDLTRIEVITAIGVVIAAIVFFKDKK